MRKSSESPPHVRKVNAEQAVELMRSCNSHPSSAFLYNLLRFLHNISFYLVSYSYGDTIADGLQSTPQAFKFHPPCQHNQKLCYDCKEFMAVISDGPPLAFLIRNSIEVSALTSAYSTVTGQAPTVPRQVLSPGELLGLLPAALAALTVNLTPTSQYFDFRPQRLIATAGARSVHF